MILSFLLSLAVHAADPINPLSLCERYITKEEIKECEFRIRAIQPDWYLAGACQHQFDNESFYECLNLSKSFDFNPVQLQKCASPDMNDSDRMSCLNEIAITSEKKLAKRALASEQDKDKKKKGNKKKKTKNQIQKKSKKKQTKTKKKQDPKSPPSGE